MITPAWRLVTTNTLIMRPAQTETALCSASITEYLNPRLQVKPVQTGDTSYCCYAAGLVELETNLRNV